MTEETAAMPPTIVTEVTVQTGAVIALTTQNAVFRNGRQLVIPHVGAQFLQELMEAMTDATFVQALIDNSIALDQGTAVPSTEECGHTSPDVFATCNATVGHDGPHTYTDERGGVTAWHDHPTLEEIAAMPDEDFKENLKAAIEASSGELCGHAHPAGLATCLDFVGHTGPHQGWQGGPADWGGGEDYSWDNEEEKSHDETAAPANIDGFEIEPYAPSPKQTTVRHVSSNKGIGISSREMAQTFINDPFGDEYERLCAKAYLTWYDDTFPGEEDWREWKAGDSLVSDKGARALVIPWQDTIAVVNDEGTYYTLDDRNTETFRHWTKTSR